MRYVIVGAGAIGGTIAAALSGSGLPVVACARGPHLDAIRRNGLRFATPAGEKTLQLAAVGSPSEIVWTPDDVAVLATKTQDTAAALSALSASAPPDTPIACAQNGVENERLALRWFRRVYGVLVIVPADHLEPGLTRCYQQPTYGILDVGGYPAGLDGVAVQVSQDLQRAGFSSRALPDVMRWKYGKLLRNLANVVEAACDSRRGEIVDRARAEAVACLQAAGIGHATFDEQDARATGLPEAEPIEGAARSGGSTWQSLSRGLGSLETPYLNGEISLLGRTHGVPTPANDLLARLAVRLIRERVPPGTLSMEQLLAS